MCNIRNGLIAFALSADLLVASTLAPTTSNVMRDTTTDTPRGITNRPAWREAIGIRFTSVKDFGADATGVTNSLPAFDAAISLASNLVATGATPLPIYVPSGTYRIDAPIRILSPKLTLYGDGYDSRIVLSTATNAIEVGDGITDVDTVTLRAFRVGTSATNSLRGIYSRGHIDSQIHGVLIDGAVSPGRRGFELAGLDMRLSWGNNLADMYAINCAGDGIYLNGVNSTVFTSPHIISCWGSGLRATNWTYGVSLFGAQVGYCDEYALLFHGSRAVTIHGGYTEFCGAKGGLRAHIGFGNCSGISVVGTHIDFGTWTNVYAVSTLNVSGLTLRGLNIDNPGPGCDALMPEAPTTYTSESVIYDGGPKTRTIAMPTLVMSDARFSANLYASNLLVGPHIEEWAPLSVSFTNNPGYDTLLRWYNSSLYLIQNRTGSAQDEWPALQLYSGTNRGVYFGGGSISGRYLDVGYGAIDRVRFLGDVLMAGDARVVSNFYAKVLKQNENSVWDYDTLRPGTNVADFPMWDGTRWTPSVGWSFRAPLTVGVGNTVTLPAASATANGYATSNQVSAWDAKVSFPGFGTSHETAAYGDHNHSGTYEPYMDTPPIRTLNGDVTGTNVTLEVGIQSSATNILNVGETLGYLPPRISWNIGFVAGHDANKVLASPADTSGGIAIRRLVPADMPTNGISATRTFVDKNNVTNTVTIDHGLITGWAQ